MKWLSEECKNKVSNYEMTSATAWVTPKSSLDWSLGLLDSTARSSGAWSSERNSGHWARAHGGYCLSLSFSLSPSLPLCLSDFVFVSVALTHTCSLAMMMCHRSLPSPEPNQWTLNLWNHEVNKPFLIIKFTASRISLQWHKATNTTIWTMAILGNGYITSYW
jgi:hypothetical protein